MPTYSQGPRLLKGAIVAIDPAGGGRSTIVFQYNPETLKRSLEPQLAGGQGGGSSLAVRYTGAPVETIDLEVTIDAVDQLEVGQNAAAATGIHPQLAALETLLYPRSDLVDQNGRLLDQGSIEIPPYVAPLTLFVWGGNRVLPVSLTRYSINEELFDHSLNPIQATVTLSLRALTYSDVDKSHPAYHLFLAYQQAKEQMARRGVTSSPNELVGVDVSRL
jgi:Contractile injection system tube protein